MSGGTTANTQQRCLAYFFEAKGIQKYVMAGGRLLDIAGASEILAATIRSEGGELLDAVLKSCGLDPTSQLFSRRAGGAFMIHFESADHQSVAQLRRLWRLAFSLAAPGLEFSDTVAQGGTHLEARGAAYASATSLRANGTASLLPLAAPFVHRSQRTALPAVQQQADELLDEMSVRKRQAGRSNAQYTQRFLPEELKPAQYVWPDHMDEEEVDGDVDQRRLFPFRDEDRRVAVVHADISGLGERYRRLGDLVSKAAALSDKERLEILLALARAIEAAVTAAARIATRTALLPEAQRRNGSFPARPILLGGDDLTIVVRADLAIPYARSFLEALEKESAVAFAAFAGSYGHAVGSVPELLTPLTACAGIAVIKARQPFHLALDLAEDLCGYAKKQIKTGTGPFPSALAFHRITTSHIADDFEAIVAAEATVWGDQGAAAGERLPEQVLTCQPYLVGEVGQDAETTGALAERGLNRLAGLEELVKALGAERLGVGALRDLATLLLTSRTLAPQAYANWRKVAGSRAPTAVKDFDDALQQLGTAAPAYGVFTAGWRGRTALFDAIEWRAFG